MRHAGLYACSIKTKLADIAQAAIDTLPPQMQLFDLAPFVKQSRRLSWRKHMDRLVDDGLLVKVNGA